MLRLPRQQFRAWDNIFAVKGFNLSKDLHFIDASEIKKITGLEPRNMAKIDFSKDLPPVFKRNRYFLLPVENGRYAIVRGEGFHQLEGVPSVSSFTSRLSFTLTTANRGQGEMQYLDYAFNSGAFEAIMNVGPLYQSIRGRGFSKAFRFRVCENTLAIRSVQIEVDSGFESESAVVLVEAKVRTPEDFIIRQLYYPYRHFQLISPRKTIIPVFFTYDPGFSAYTFWIYRFRVLEDYNSIELERSQSLRIITPSALRLSDICPKGIVQYQELIPQANDLDKVIELVFKVSEGRNDYQQIAAHFAFDRRQSSYYREAAEALGLVRSKTGKYILTKIGEELVSLPTENRHLFIVSLLADFHLIKRSLDIIESEDILTKRHVMDLIHKSSSLSGTTISRRADSLFAWLKWIGAHTGIFMSTKDKRGFCLSEVSDHGKSGSFHK